MNEVLKKLLSHLKNPKILLTIGLAGILLIGLSSFSGSSEKSASNKHEDDFSAEKYRAEIEENICEMVKSISGDSKAKVVVTLESGAIYSYADVNEDTSADKTENNAKSTTSAVKRSYITVKTSDGGEQALLITTEMPAIRGIAVVCERGDESEINKKITDAVCAALDITSRRVFVAGKN